MQTSTNYQLIIPLFAIVLDSFICPQEERIFHERGMVKRKWNSTWNHAQKNLGGVTSPKYMLNRFILATQGACGICNADLWSLVLTANRWWSISHPYACVWKKNAISKWIGTSATSVPLDPSIPTFCSSVGQCQKCAIPEHKGSLPHKYKKTSHPTANLSKTTLIHEAAF